MPELGVLAMDEAAADDCAQPSPDRESRQRKGGAVPASMTEIEDALLSRAT